LGALQHGLIIVSSLFGLGLLERILPREFLLQNILLCNSFGTI
jgi:hypothetical protein